MRSVTTTLPLPESLSTHDPFSHLDPATTLQRSSQPHNHLYSPHPAYPSPIFPVSPNPAMDLQYILSPSILLEDQQQQQKQQQPVQQSPHPPLVFQDKHQLVPPASSDESVPSSSRVVAPSQHVHPNPDDAIITFDSKTRSFPKPTKTSTPVVADPYAEDFLRDMLGPAKWETFSTRLFERRLGGKGKGKAKQGEEDDPKAGVSAVEFLVKVEVVKSILRECVPHPYNPRKSLSHPYSPAPSGHVTLTRSTVLLLCGWSNTQFSYWARRSEAVSVLSGCDSRLRAVATALERRLRGDPPLAPEEEDEGTAVTGKGLDSIIEEVKKRTGKSQFLRGKHSSLDAFGTIPQDPTVPPPLPQYAMPTFQAERYDHGTRSEPPINPRTSSKRKPPHSHAPPLPTGVGDSMSSSLVATSQELASPTSASSSHPVSRSLQMNRKAAVTVDDSAHHFPVSDSRTEIENPVSGSGVKRKASDDDDVGVVSNKRARKSEEDS